MAEARSIDAVKQPLSSMDQALLDFELSSLKKEASRRASVTPLDNDLAGSNVNKQGTILPGQPGSHITSKGSKVSATPPGQTRGQQSAVPGSQQGPIKWRFKDFARAVETSPIEAKIQADRFRDLDSLGPQSLIEYTSGGWAPQNVRRFTQLKNWFNTMRGMLQKEGVNIGFRDDYLPLVWEQPDAVVASVYNSLGLKPSITKTAKLSTYQQLVNAGLTPKYKTLGDLVHFYTEKANNLVAAKRLLNGFGVRKSYASSNLADLEKFVQSNQKTLSAENIEDFGHLQRFLQKPWPWLQTVADTFRIPKTLSLSGGIPDLREISSRSRPYLEWTKGIGSGWNWHGFTTAYRAGMVGGPKLALKTVRDMTLPDNAEMRFKQAEKFAAFASKNSDLNLNFSDYKLNQKAPEGFLGKSNDWVDRVWGKGLFEKVLPTLKLEYTRTRYYEMMKDGMPWKEAIQSAANESNAAFGGLRTSVEGRSQNARNAASVALLAPDWLESNLRAAKLLATSLARPRASNRVAARRVLANTTLAYMTASFINKQLTGKWMHENDKGEKLSIIVGKDDNGKKRVIPFLGGAIEPLRLPYETVESDKDVGRLQELVRNRLSIPAQTGVKLTSGVDEFGRPLFKESKYVNKTKGLAKNLGTVTKEVGKMYTPQGLDAAFDLAAGKISQEEALMRTFEVPVRYRRGRNGSLSKSLRVSPLRVKLN